jgi:RNA polymerase sigma-70 factor (ECF subfamily)
VEEVRTDGEIVAASIEEADQFGVIFERHSSDIWRFLARRVGRDLAAEFTGEVFARAFEKRERFDTSRQSARPWLYGIATNVVGDYLRRRDVRNRRSRAVGVGMLERHPNPYDQADGDIDARRFRPQFDEALSRLRRRDRDTLILYAVEGLTYAEVAEALDIPTGTVRSRLSRARQRMRELLPPEIQTVLHADEGTS